VSLGTQHFLVNGQSSGLVVVDCIVPQASVLGRIKFITYTEDVSTVFHRHRVRYYLHADDKEAYRDVEEVSLASCVVQDCMSDVATWCSSRRL